MEWLNFGATVVAILVGGFIAYHVYFLQKRLTFTGKMRHMEAIRNKVEEHLLEIERDKLNHEVMLVNVKRYDKHYVGENNKSRHGYVELRAELKAVRYDGIEFFAEMPKQAYYDVDGKLTLDKTDKEAFTVLPVGLVPYSWIEFIDWRGDEFRYSPIFFVHYKGKDKYPYKYMTYYKKRDRDGRNEPYDMQYERVEL